MSTEAPSIGWHFRWRTLQSREREWVLKGDWSRPYRSKVPRVRKLLVSSYDCTVRTLDFLKLFPALEELRVLSYDVEDVSGLYHLPHLQSLSINRMRARDLRLDLSQFIRLRSLSLLWSEHILNLNTLKHLRHLHLHHIYGVKHLDLSFHPRLHSLHVGPAKGIQSVSLDGLKHLRRLTLAVMPRLKHISGRHFYPTVTELDIRGSHLIPRKVLASFNNLKRVLIGMPSPLTSHAFPKCKPKITRFPI